MTEYKSFKTIHDVDMVDPSGTTTLTSHILNSDPHPNFTAKITALATEAVNRALENLDPGSTPWEGVLSNDGSVRDRACHVGNTTVICTSGADYKLARNNLFYHDLSIMLNDSEFGLLDRNNSYWLPAATNVPFLARVRYFLYNTQETSVDVVMHAGSDAVTVQVPASQILEVVFTCVTKDGGTTREWTVLYDIATGGALA